jgi:hypothetical protein
MLFVLLAFTGFMFCVTGVVVYKFWCRAKRVPQPHEALLMDMALNSVKQTSSHA